MSVSNNLVNLANAGYALNSIGDGVAASCLVKSSNTNGELVELPLVQVFSSYSYFPQFRLGTAEQIQPRRTRWQAH